MTYSFAPRRTAAYMEYARMKCPYGCERKDPRRPADWSIPGLKRHVRALHPAALDLIVWPPLYADSASPGGDLIAQSLTLNPMKPFEEMTVRELRAAAKRRGIPQFGKNRKDFIDALTA